MIKEKRKTQRRDFKCPHLCRDDLKQIIDLLLTELKPDQYSIESDKYDFENSSDLLNDGSVTSNFDIHIYSYGIYIVLHRSYAYIEYNAGDSKIRGIASKIIEIIEKKERKILFFTQKMYLLFCFLSVVPAAFISVCIENFNKIKLSIDFLLMLVIVLSIIFLSIISFFIKAYFYSKITFKDKKDIIGFWDKNKDQIIIGIITGLIVTIIGGIIVGLYLNKKNG